MSESDADDWRGHIENGRAILLGIHVRSGSASDIETILSKSSRGRVVHAEWED
jgi:hypothetical protein